MRSAAALTALPCAAARRLRSLRRAGRRHVRGRKLPRGTPARVRGRRGRRRGDVRLRLGPEPGLVSRRRQAVAPDRAPDGAGLGGSRPQASTVSRDDRTPRADRRARRSDRRRADDLRHACRAPRAGEVLAARRARRWRADPGRRQSRRSQGRGGAVTRRPGDRVAHPDAGLDGGRSPPADDRVDSRPGALPDVCGSALAAGQPFVVTFASTAVLPEPDVRACRGRRLGGAQEAREHGRALHPRRDLQGQRSSQRGQPVGRRMEASDGAVHVVVDRKGVVRTKLEGAFSTAELERAVRQVVST